MYRVPGRSTIGLSGEFRVVDNWKDCPGFVISTFAKDKLYAFEQGKEEGGLFLPDTEEPCASQEEYLAAAGYFLENLKGRSLDKAVFSRIRKIPFHKNPRQLFFRLAELYPEAFVYLVSSPLFGTWIGATPEILISAREGRATTMALAGTLPADDDGTWGQKEKDEQEIVRDYIRNVLETSGVNDLKEAGRSEYTAGPVKHLVSRFDFEVEEGKVPDLALALHPTPAVSGLPQEKAVDLIAETEGHDRKLYAGIIGYLGKEESQLFVNLRCAQVTKEAMYLYLGGGFTADSDVEKEWEETENKARTLLNVVEDL